MGVIKATTSRYTPDPPSRTPEDVSEQALIAVREGETGLDERAFAGAHCGRKARRTA